MPRIRKGYAEGHWGQIHYMECGHEGGARHSQEHGHEHGEAEPLLLLHQSPTDSVQFARVMRPLAVRGIHAIAIDLPGFGGSDTPSAPPTVADYAHIVPAVLDQLGIASASVLGHHTGAVIATESALQFADRVKKVVLNGPLPMSDEERAMWRQLLAREKDWNLHWDGSHLTELWNFRFGAQPAWTDLEAFHANFIHGLLAGRHVWYAHDAVMTYKHEEAMQRLQQPCLILANTGDAIYSFSERAKQLYPHFAYAELQGGTIDIIDEQPGAWSEIVANFVKA